MPFAGFMETPTHRWAHISLYSLVFIFNIINFALSLSLILDKYKSGRVNFTFFTSIFGLITGVPILIDYITLRNVSNIIGHDLLLLATIISNGLNFVFTLSAGLAVADIVANVSCSKVNYYSVSYNIHENWTSICNRFKATSAFAFMLCVLFFILFLFNLFEVVNVNSHQGGLMLLNRGFKNDVEMNASESGSSVEEKEYSAPDNGPSIHEASVHEQSVRAPSVHSPSVRTQSVRSPSVRAASVRSPSMRAPSTHQPSITEPRTPIPEPIPEVPEVTTDPEPAPASEPAHEPELVLETASEPEAMPPPEPEPTPEEPELAKDADSSGDESH